MSHMNPGYNILDRTYTPGFSSPAKPINILRRWEYRREERENTASLVLFRMGADREVRSTSVGVVAAVFDFAGVFATVRT